MGYNQFIQMTLVNKSKKRVYHIDHASVSWGKFYENPDKDHEVASDKINGREIKPQGSITIAACGRENAASGTEGSFDIYEGATKVGNIYWNNPWKAGAANSVVSKAEGDYLIDVGAYDNTDAAIGSVEIKIAYAD